ncbi:MAG: PH domain-containing protein [Planctomycetota bacterium]|nr:PH domain-containing protein [Planctomycetota bacterium]
MKLGPNEQILKTAVFQKDEIIKYHWVGLALLSLFIVTIPITLIAAIVYKIVLDRVIGSWECILTNRSLNVKKGVFNKIEKTVPLEKITDLQMAQGPIMRMFDLHRISVETAGTSGPGSLISLIGIKDTESFRRDVLEQRDRNSAQPAPGESGASALDESVLVEIRDSLARTEGLLQQLVDRAD